MLLIKTMKGDEFLKRIFILIVSFAIFVASVFGVRIAYADDNYIVKADDIIVNQGETITVPLKLTGNNGLMGFRLSVKYPDNQLILTDVSSGSITAEGLFNTTITDYYSVKGGFDVVWSQNTEIKEDGTLFIMTYKVKETAMDGEYNISVTYSSEDTFDEKFEDVKFNCSPIKVYIGDVTVPDTQQKETTTKVIEEDGNNKQVSDDYLISSVEQMIQSLGENDIESLTEEQQNTVVEYVNNRIDSYGGGKKYSSFDELKQDYIEATKNEAARKIVESTDPEVIIKVADEVLKEYGGNSFSEIPTDKKQVAVDKMLQKLADQGADEEGFKYITSIDDAAEALDKAVDSAREEKDKTVTPKKEKVAKGDRKSVIITIVCLVGLASVILIFILIKKEKHK